MQISDIPKCYSVVNRIINRTDAQNRWRYTLGKPRVNITAKRIQKIIYLCQLFWFIDHENSDMIPEDFVAWPNGPVIPEIYNYWLVYQDGDMCPCPYVKHELSKEEIEIINSIVDNTIDISTETIIDYTQRPFGPWEQSYKSPDEPFSIIPKSIIKQYICNEQAQKELIDFIKDKTEKSKSLGFSKKLTPTKHIDQ